MVVPWRKAEDGKTGIAECQCYVRVLGYIKKIGDIKLFSFNPMFCKIGEKSNLQVESCEWMNTRISWQNRLPGRP